MDPLAAFFIGAVLGGVLAYVAGTLLASDSSSELKSAQERILDLEKQRDELTAETQQAHELIAQVKDAASKDHDIAASSQSETARLLAKYEPPKRSHHKSKERGGSG
jgi:gas vesicle protein